jgi:tRNA A37 methylthiotransferase MiaB
MSRGSHLWFHPEALNPCSALANLEGAWQRGQRSCKQSHQDLWMQELVGMRTDRCNAVVSVLKGCWDKCTFTFFFFFF